MTSVFTKKHRKTTKNPCSYAGKKQPKFSVDTALLRIETPREKFNKVSFWAQSTECYKCPMVKICNMKHNTSQVLVNTTFASEWAIQNTHGRTICNKQKYKFNEYGEYHLNLSLANTSCQIEVTKMTSNPNLPVLYTFFVYMFLAFLYCSAVFIHKQDNRYNVLLDENSSVSNEQPETLGSIPNTSKPAKQRLIFLDTFRGICIAVMIFVNYGGGQYWYFKHSSWNGLTVADLVFPWFMFIMGTSMALSFESLLKKQTLKSHIYWKIVRRTLILFALGLFISNGNRDWKTFRIPGVLQRLSVAYFVVAMIRALTAVPAEYIKEMQLQANGWKKIVAPLRDVYQYWIEWLIMGTFTAIYLLITFLLPVPECPKGYLGPGGLGDGAVYGNCTGGAAGYIDKWAFGRNHIYSHPTCKHLYNTSEPYDPEGILGSLMSILAVFLGLQAGQILMVYNDLKSRAVRFITWSIIYGLIAGILCKFSQNGGWIPVNKNLWSPSFVLALASMANILVVVLYWIIDVKHWWTGGPFFFVGMNSILIYLGHEVFHHYIPFSWRPVPESHAAHLAMNLWGASLWVIIAYYMHYIKFYVSI